VLFFRIVKGSIGLEVFFSQKHHLIHPNSKRNGKSTSPQGTLEHVFTIEEDSQGEYMVWR
jgi:hypothetical protein